MSNEYFLTEMFTDPTPGTFQWVTSFLSDPKKAAGNDWRGGPVKHGFPLRIKEQGNTFFNISTLKLFGNQVARKEENFDALHVVVLDDIGTKATLPDGIRPTYLLETSPGNFQAGFKLSNPCRDLKMAKALYKSLIRAGLSDAGFGGPHTRYARLPIGVNHKDKCGPGGFPHKMAQWNRDLTFSIGDLVTHFGLKLESDAEETVPCSETPKTAAPFQTDEIIIGKLLRSAKGARVWSGDNTGFDSGSDADQYLLNCIAFKTLDPRQIERVYSKSPRADRKSSDGVCKWRTRKDYRQRSIEAAIRFAEAHPNGDTEEASAKIEAAIATAKASGDTRCIYDPEVIEAFATLQKGDAGNYDHHRKQARKVGVTLSTLDAEIKGASEAQSLSHDDAAELAIAKLGGAGSLIFNRGRFWNWRQEQGKWKEIESDETVKKVIHGVLPKSQINGGTVGSILSVLRTKVANDDIEFNSPENQYVINCLSGTLHLRSLNLDAIWGSLGLEESVWELRPHRREDYFTSCIPVAWEPNAQCPRFDKFLLDITRGDDDADDKIKFLKEFAGYSLTTSTEEEIFCILYGDKSSNGKSTYLAVIRALAGPENTSALSLHQLGERFGLAGLQSKLVNICAEIPRGATLPDDVIKKLTSGDTITVERKGLDC